MMFQNETKQNKTKQTDIRLPTTEQQNKCRMNDPKSGRLLLRIFLLMVSNNILGNLEGGLETKS